MKLRSIHLTSAGLVMLIVLLACSTLSTPQPQTANPTSTVQAIETQTAAVPETATPTAVSASTVQLGAQYIESDPAKLAQFAPGQPTNQLVVDRYGSHYYLMPSPPLDAFPNMTTPLAGPTYETRPGIVPVNFPGCTATMTAGTPCSVWAIGDHAFVEAYADQWQPTANISDQFPFDAGGQLLFERMDDTYLYAATADGTHYTFVLSTISLTPPTPNLVISDTEKYYWWSIPLYAPWGPLDTNLVEINKIYTVFSYNIGHQYEIVFVCSDAATLIAQNETPSQDPNCIFEGRDNYLPARVLAVTQTGLWLEYQDGTIGFSLGAHTWHFQPGFYVLNGIPYPGGALTQ